ncbi:MAG: hypothetical protein K1X75_07750 [Leptospirales bacterium]|nr:hypothetical protein [Leptospirales bacterium]
MEVDRFLMPKLTGRRFEGHAIPLEFLKDLAVFEELILEVAKAKFLDDHPGRKRSPRGFTEGIELKLTAIEEGSALAIISLSGAVDSLFPTKGQTYFEHARESIVGAISAAELNEPVTAHLPERALAYFDRIGRSLRDGEAIELTTPQRQEPAKLTKASRRRLILASNAVKELTEVTSVRGLVPAADQDSMTCEVQLTDGRKIKAPIAAEHLETILEAFNGYRIGLRALLQGIGRFNRNERLLGFESLEDIVILDPLDISARLDEMRILKSGWLEGRGSPPSSEGMDWLSRTFPSEYPEELPLPHLYPTEEGNVRAEWSLEYNEASLEIDLATHEGEWHVLNLETDEEDVIKWNLDESESWRQLRDKVQLLTGGRA